MTNVGVLSYRNVNIVGTHFTAELGKGKRQFV